MTKSTTQLTFIPLDPTSQGNKENVLYYKTDASYNAIYQCAMLRLKAATDLLASNYQPTNKPNNLPKALSILLSDAIILLEEINPIAIKLKTQYKKQKG